MQYKNVQTQQSTNACCNSRPHSVCVCGGGGMKGSAVFISQTACGKKLDMSSGMVRVQGSWGLCSKVGVSRSKVSSLN